MGEGKKRELRVCAQQTTRDLQRLHCQLQLGLCRLDGSRRSGRLLSVIRLFLLPEPCSNNSEEPRGSVLVYHDSCSKAGCHDGVPPWKASLLQRYVQMPAPEFNKNTAEDQSPDGWESLVEESECVSGRHPHTCRVLLKLSDTY